MERVKEFLMAAAAALLLGFLVHVTIGVTSAVSPWLTRACLAGFIIVGAWLVTGE
jgi:hypothetical protein